MKTRLILKPGQKGTKRLTEIYGDSLLCIRFRYDEVTRQRLKTVELIIDKSEWVPPPPRYDANRLVPLRIEGYELEMRARAKTAGAKWNPERQLWFVKYGNIEGSVLEKHLQVDEIDKQG